MKFIEAMKEVAYAGGNAMRRPEMAGYVKAENVVRSLTASVTAATFGTAVNHVTGQYVFEYTGSAWIMNGTTSVSTSAFSSTYGISTTGTLYKGDTVTITYTYTSGATTPNVATAQAVMISVRNIVFTRWNLEDGPANVTQASFPVNVSKSGDIIDTGAVTVTSGGASTLSITAYLMTAILAKDWFVTTVEKSERAYTGGTLW